MAVPRPVISYCFAYVRERPKTWDEANQTPALALQFRLIHSAKLRGEISIVQSYTDFTTNRRSAFFDRRIFKEAVQKALNEGADLAVGDIAQLVATIPLEKLPDITGTLDNCSVTIWDSLRRTTWQSLSPDIRGAIVIEAQRTSTARSFQIKHGLRKTKERSRPANLSNQKKGVAANVSRANRLASKLEAIVREEEEKVPSGQSLSPSRLAALLNERQILAPRGGKWSHNSAKNLLERIRRPSTN